MRRGNRYPEHILKKMEMETDPIKANTFDTNKFNEYTPKEWIDAYLNTKIIKIDNKNGKPRFHLNSHI